MGIPLQEHDYVKTTDLVKIGLFPKGTSFATLVNTYSKGRFGWKCDTDNAWVRALSGHGIPWIKVINRYFTEKTVLKLIVHVTTEEG